MKNDPYKFAGSTLANRYLIEELLGIGGMAAVYRARHLVTTRMVAVKILKPDLVYENDRMIADFLNEAKATARLNHRNIIEVTDADLAEDSVAFLAMQYLRGETLEKLLDEVGQMPLDRAAQLFDQLCDGVAHAHDAGIVHRDLKPSNIMIESDTRGEEIVKILDFGIAKALDSTANVSRPIGTLYYASPEQLSLGSQIDHRSDIYSLGIILYQMLTGEAPFEGDSMERIIYQKLNFAPPLLRQQRPDLPAAVEKVVAKALAKDPALRYQSATGMSRAFWRAISLETGALKLDTVDVVARKGVAGASVYLNGKYAGQTDLEGRWRQVGLLPRQYLIEVEHPKFETWRATAPVSSREEAAVTVELNREPKGELIIACNVPGATLLLDGRKVGVADETGRLSLEDVAAGRRSARAIYPKRLPAEAEVEVAAGEMAFVELKLAPKPASFPKTALIGGMAAALLLIASLVAASRAKSSGSGLNRSTPTPTVTPTATPTPDPTITPTPDPTISPSPLPSSTPRPSPTFKPTLAPKPTPTVKPTPAPKSSPTIISTPAPTSSPAPPIISLGWDEMRWQPAPNKPFPAWQTILPGVKVSGSVNVDVFIDENGDTTPLGANGSSAALQSDKVLGEAMKAARGWKFRPFERGGRRVRVRGVITFKVDLK